MIMFVAFGICSGPKAAGMLVVLLCDVVSVALLSLGVGVLFCWCATDRPFVRLGFERLLRSFVRCSFARILVNFGQNLQAASYVDKAP